MNKKYLVVLVVSIVLLAGSGYAIRNTAPSSDKIKILKGIDRMQRLLLYSKLATGTYENAIPQPRKKGDRYSYTVSGKVYDEQVEIDAAPQKARFDVQYLPDTASIHSISPALELQTYQDALSNLTNEGAPMYIWLLGLIGLCGFVFSLKKLVVKDV
jgi:hypothetical protein